MTPSEKMSKARTNLVMLQPFFGALAMTMKLIEDPKIPTAQTDGARLWYNPKWIDKLPITQVTGLIAHETLHPALLHMTRRGARDPERWNAAGDFVINPIVREAGMDLPPGGLEDAQYKGMSTDEVYDKLPKNFCTSGGGAGGGWNWGGVIDAQDNVTEVEANAKLRLAQAVLVGKQAGNLPSSISRLVDDLLTPTIPWREILWRFMTEPNEVDFSWTRPNRRMLPRGIFLPMSLAQDSAMQDIVVAIDTSGSIDEEQLQEFAAELNGIHKQVRPRRTVVIYCDARIGRVDSFGPSDELTLEAVGGGGTDFHPPFKYVEEEGLNPKCLVYFTDGYGPFPAEEPPFPTLWVINSDVKAPYGETLTLHKT